MGNVWVIDYMFVLLLKKWTNIYCISKNAWNEKNVMHPGEDNLICLIILPLKLLNGYKKILMDIKLR